MSAKLRSGAGCQRAACYYTLGNLLEKQLAVRIEKGSYQFFTPEPPAKLVALQQEKLESARQLLPELESIRNTLGRKPRVKFFEGRRGIEEILTRTDETAGEVVGFTDLSAMMQLFPRAFKQQLNSNIKRGIRMRYISPKPGDPKALAKQLPLSKSVPLLEILFVNERQFPFENEVAIYESTVAIMSLTAKEMIAVLVESPSVAKSFRSVFDLSWLGATSFIAV